MSMLAVVLVRMKAVSSLRAAGTEIMNKVATVASNATGIVQMKTSKDSMNSKRRFVYIIGPERYFRK